MSQEGIRHKLGSVLNEAKESIKELADELRGSDELMIMPYRGYGRADRIFLMGRVLEDEGIGNIDPEGRRTTLLDNIKRFGTDEVPGAKLKITFGKNVFETFTDQEGYYRLEEDLPLPVAPNGERWLYAEVELLEAPNYPDQQVVVRAPIYYPNPDAAVGIISDVDDTVLETAVNSRLKLKTMYLTFFRSAGKRVAIKGVPQLYRDLVVGNDTKQDNPVFYVSAGPWNIFDMLKEFMELQQLPKGPIMLQDFGIPTAQQREGWSRHKQDTIGKILDMYPWLNFIMLGDTSGHDADNYTALAAAYPGRIEAVYIHATRHTRKDARVAAIVEAATDIDMLLVNSTAEIRAHARSKGWLADQV